MQPLKKTLHIYFGWYQPSKFLMDFGLLGRKVEDLPVFNRFCRFLEVQGTAVGESQT